MSLTDVAQGEVETSPDRRSGHGHAAMSAGLRALFAAVSGLLLTSGIAVVLWAVTPSSAGGPQQSLRAAVAAFAAGNAMTLSIGRAALTLPPLMITVVAIGLLAGIGSRGQADTDDRTGEFSRTVAAAAVYAAVVTVAGVVLGTAGAVAAEQWWRPFLVAFVVVGVSVYFRGSAWRNWVLARVPLWVPVAARLGAAGAAGVLAAGAAAVVVGLAGSFGDSSTVQTLAAPGPAAGFGMALLGIAYLPNAVLAGAGYVTGVGFHLGAGTYSPFGSSPVELPAVSLLAAAPDGHQASRVGMVLLLLPVAVALVLGWAAARRLGARRERLLAVGTGGVFAGVLLAVTAVVAGGGITGGQWATTGAPPLLLGAVAAVVLGVFGAVTAGMARQSAVADPADAADRVDAADSGELRADDPDEAVADPIDGEGAPDDAVADNADGSTADGADDAAADDAAAGGEVALHADTDLPEEAADEAAGDDSADAALADPSGTGIADVHDDADDTRREVAAGASPVAAPRAEGDLGDTADDDASAAAPPGSDPVSNRVPQARREEDVLAESAGSSDADLVDHLRPRVEPRQAG